MSQDSINTIAEDCFETLSYFEFKRIRAANIKSDNKEIDNDNNFIYKIPTRRSGHIAVCNEENLWVIEFTFQKNIQFFFLKRFNICFLKDMGWIQSSRCRKCS